MQKLLVGKTAVRRWDKKGLVTEVNGKKFIVKNEVKYEIVKEGEKFKLVPVQEQK